MHAFSYPSGISNEAKKDKCIYGLEQSVTFGRLMPESFSWEKWSSLSRNKYVEEAKAFSRPGSVKQMKVYFEAHFKRMAALKAAALALEQANAAKGGAPDEPSDDSEVHGYVSKIDDLACSHAHQLALSSPPRLDSNQCVQKEAEDPAFVANHNEDNSNYDEAEESETRELLMDAEKENSSTKVESVDQPSVVCSLKENMFTTMGRKSWIDDPDKKRTPLRASINRLISPVFKKIGSCYEASNKDCSAPLNTPSKHGVSQAFVDGMTNAPQETLPTGKRRGAKSRTEGKTKTRFPIIPKSFCLSANRVPRSSREKERQEVPTEKIKAADEQSPKKGRSRCQSTHPKAPRMSRRKTRVKAENVI